MTAVSPLDALHELEVADEMFFDAILHVGMQQGFSNGLSLVVPKKLRPAFVLALLKFRKVWTLQRRGSELKFIEFLGQEVAGSEDNNASHQEPGRLKLIKDLDYPMHLVLTQLIQLGYWRGSTVTQVGDFLTLGDVIRIWPVGFATPVQIEYFGDTIDLIYSYNASTGKSIVQFDKIEIEPVLESESAEKFELIEDLPKTNSICLLFDPDTIDPKFDSDFVQKIEYLHENNISTVNVSGFGESADILKVADFDLVLKLNNSLKETNLGAKLDEFLHGKQKIKRKKVNRIPLQQSRFRFLALYIVCHSYQQYSIVRAIL
ncbi:hypothetical protein FACS1894125_5910 [Actinomycetota bacterium]|nr:hypothetical protein FACS1894125_5910 [Actinomycetota bacterium]